MLPYKMLSVKDIQCLNHHIQSSHRKQVSDGVENSLTARKFFNVYLGFWKNVNHSVYP
jgi:hypothetical protein